jgi:hypothetical protein
MRSASDKVQPARAQKGARLGIAAYVRSRNALQRWSPPPC